MRGGVLAGLIAGVLAGVVGFGIGRAASARQSSHPSPGAPPVAEEKRGVRSEPRSLPSSPSNNSAPKKQTKPEIDLAKEIQSRFLDLMLPVFADDDYRLRKCMFAVTLRNASAQDAVLDLVMTLEDRATIEDCAALLTYAKEPKFVARLAQAFNADDHPARRAALAVALGQSVAFEEAHPAVESILGGKDAALKIAALRWLNVESISRKPEVLAWVVPSLRTLVMGGETAEVRVAATQSLKGDASESGVAFLLERVLQDPHVEVQKSAMGALPLGIYSIVSPMPAEQLSVLWNVFGDPARDGALRTQAAYLILSWASRKAGTLSDEQRQTLNSWIEARKKDAPR
jgi:hypothetical protein